MDIITYALLKNYVDKKIPGGGGLPEVTTDDNGKVLGVVEGEWAKTLISTCEKILGAPTKYTGEVGKIVIDSSTNKMYVCVNYIDGAKLDPSNLTGAKVRFISNPNLINPAPTGSSVFSFESDDRELERIFYSANDGIYYTAYYQTPGPFERIKVYDDSTKVWTKEKYRTITINSAIKDTSVAQWVINNSECLNDGYIWEEINVLPKVSYLEDEGKVLKVVGGKWTPASGGGLTAELIGEFDGTKGGPLWFNLQGGEIVLTKYFGDYTFLKFSTYENANSNVYQSELLYVPDIVTQEMQLYSDNLVHLKWNQINGIRFHEFGNKIVSSGTSGQLKIVRVYGIK